MLGEPFGNGSRHYHHRRGQRQAGLNYKCPVSKIVCTKEAWVPNLGKGGGRGGVWLGRNLKGGGGATL